MLTPFNHTPPAAQMVTVSSAWLWHAPAAVEEGLHSKREYSMDGSTPVTAATATASSSLRCGALRDTLAHYRGRAGNCGTVAKQSREAVGDAPVEAQDSGVVMRDSGIAAERHASDAWYDSSQICSRRRRRRRRRRWVSGKAQGIVRAA
jgi:hypothetical protein